MLRTPLTRRSAQRVQTQKALADRKRSEAAAASRTLARRKKDLLQKGVPAVVLVATGAYFGKRLLDRYRYHRKVEKFEAALQRDGEAEHALSAEELAEADSRRDDSGLSVFDILNAAIATLALVRRFSAATGDSSRTDDDDPRAPEINGASESSDVSDASSPADNRGFPPA